MPCKPRIQYTKTDKTLMWDRWRKGESLESIAKLFDRTHGSVAGIPRRTGGIRPPKRVRSRRALSLAEREEISRGVVAGQSPRQIAGWLKRTYPDDETCQVSHETIYRTLFIQARGALKKELLQHLRRTRRMRRSRHHTQKTVDRGRIKDTVSISERLAEAEDRAVPGHWEGDLLFGSKNSQIATLVERHTRYVLIAT